MRPFFTYYGGKWRAAPKYPQPRHGTIIEPFAGSAGYSVRYADHDVTLVDRNPVITGLWRYLIRVSASEIRQLPSVVECVDDLHVCQEAKWLIGFWLTAANVRPVKTPNAWMRGKTNPGSFWGDTVKARIASQVGRIRHWKVVEGSFESVPNVVGTWFVDPPYTVSGAGYTHGSKSLDYVTLGKWAQARRGRVIVCEQEGAQWLPFKPFCLTRSLPQGSQLFSPEAIWTTDSVEPDVCLV